MRNLTHEQFDAIPVGSQFDNRFFVLNGRVYDVYGLENAKTKQMHYLVVIYDAEGVFNASYAPDMEISKDTFVTALEFDSKVGRDNWLIDSVTRELWESEY